MARRQRSRSCRASRASGSGSAAKRPSLLRAVRGSASAEGAIVLPFFILIFICIGYMARRYEHGIAALSDARRDGWQVISGGCGGGGPDGELQGQVNGSYRAYTGAKVAIAASHYADIDQPTEIRQRIESVSRPQVLGGGARDMRGRLISSCNEVVANTEAESTAAVLDAFCRITGTCL